MSKATATLFLERLYAMLHTRCTNAWYPDEPLRGSGYRSLSFDAMADPMLVRSGLEAGISAIELSDRLAHTRGTVMFINPGEVRVRTPSNTRVLCGPPMGRSELPDFRSPATRRRTRKSSEEREPNSPNSPLDPSVPAFVPRQSNSSVGSDRESVQADESTAMPSSKQSERQMHRLYQADNSQPWHEAYGHPIAAM